MQFVNKMIAAMKTDGLLVDNLVFDDLVHRVPTKTKPNKKDGYYVAFSSGSAVYYGNWITGVEKAYSVQTNISARDNSLALRAARDAYKQEKAAKQLASAKQFTNEWDNTRELEGSDSYDLLYNNVDMALSVLDGEAKCVLNFTKMRAHELPVPVIIDNCSAKNTEVSCDEK